jgi:hypothetical protein
MLILQGEQGSAKTTLVRIPKIIVDPDRSSQEHDFLFLRQFGYRHRGRMLTRWLSRRAHAARVTAW